MAEENTEENVQELSGTEKSAILMMLLGEDEAAAVLQKLTPREVQHLGTAMYSVTCLLYTSPSPRDRSISRMPSSA